MNALVGEKLAIVTAKPQTTRSRILGIRSLPGAQILFLDTPGLHGGGRALHRVLDEQALEAARGCDLALLLADLGAPWTDAHARLRDELEARESPIFAVGTELDLPEARRAARRSGAGVLRVGSQRRGVPELVAGIAAGLPEAPPLYPDSHLDDRPLRFLAAELVREAAFEELQRELPYALAVEVVSFDESRPDLVRIRGHLLAERTSQKQIAIGRGGAVSKRIGTRARGEIERLLVRKVHLEL